MLLATASQPACHASARTGQWILELILGQKNSHEGQQVQTCHAADSKPLANFKLTCFSHATANSFSNESKSTAHLDHDTSIGNEASATGNLKEGNPHAPAVTSHGWWALKI